MVSNLQHSGYAISITDDSGVQVLLHIGLDTVNLAGQGFSALVEQGQRVEAGQPLIEFDADYVALHARSLLTLMLVVSGEPFRLLTPDSGLVACAQPVLHLSLGDPRSSDAQEEGEALFSKPVHLPNFRRSTPRFARSSSVTARPSRIRCSGWKAPSRFARPCLRSHWRRSKLHRCWR